jgi:geranylgeranyl transferase type-2 subunit beta
MIVSTRLLLLGMTLMVWLSLSAAPATGGIASPDNNKVDLNKTLALFEGWAERDNFPDSVPLAYYNAFAQQALRGDFLPGTRSRVFSFVKRCQRPDGGFVSNRKFPGESNIIYTFYALKALELTGSLDGIDQAKALGFIQSLIRDDGSIAPSPGELKRANLASTFYGVKALAVLGKIDLVDKDKTRAYVLTHHNDDGGFGVMPKGASSPQGVSMAVQTLAVLNGLTPKIITPAVTYLENSMSQLGLSSKRHRAFSTMQASADILDALVAMQALNEVETAPLQTFVESLYIPENGGFGPIPSYGTSPPSTFQGVYCLKILGQPPMPVVTPRKDVEKGEGGEVSVNQLKP